MSAVHLSQVVASLSAALDLTGGQARGHAVRTAVIGMRVAEALGLDGEQRSALFYALLLKDAGCSANAAQTAALFGGDEHPVKADRALVEDESRFAMAAFLIRNTKPGAPLPARLKHLAGLGARLRETPPEHLISLRCERGADIALMLDLPRETAAAIGSAFERWNGEGGPAGRAGEDIPLLARIVGIAQRAELYRTARGGDEAAREMVRRGRGTRFDPQVADAFLALGDAVFAGLDEDPAALLTPLEPRDRALEATDERLDRIAVAFAHVIDAKSPFTATHSHGVADIAVGIAGALGLPAADVRTLRRAGLLHDLGKLGVSNAILDKPGKLDAEEWEAIRRHPRLTYDLLHGVDAFRPLAAMAAAHHERLDGSGYHRGVDGSALGPLARILAVADVAEALSAERPYRPALGPDEVLEIMRRDVPDKLDATAFAALESTLPAQLAAA